MTSREVIASHRDAGRRFAAGGIESFVREIGEGPPVLCLHGVPASSFLYRKVIVELANRGLRGVSIDLPGLGLADRPTSSTPGPGWDGSAWPRLRRSASSASTS